MLLDMAYEFVERKFKNKDGVTGVLLMGSASLGYQNGLSDIDLEVVASRELCNTTGDTCGSEQYRGIDVFSRWITFEELEAKLRDWKDDTDLWAYSKSRILLDPKHRVEGLLAGYRQYPKAIRLEKLFHYWFFATGNAPYDSAKAIQRRDFVTAQLYFIQAMEYYTPLIFILNNSFVPYRKWRLKELSKLTFKPKDYEENLRKVLTVRNWTVEELEAKQNIINQLVTSLEKKLTEAGVSEEKLKNPWKFKVNYTPRV